MPAEYAIQAVHGRSGPGGAGLITLKLPQAGPTAILRQAQEILRGAFAGQQGRCLFYNRNEVTVLLRR